MSKEIIFTKILKDVPDIFYPKPADRVLPEWYKKTRSYLGDYKGVDLNNPTTATVKKCMPVFDALTSGYIIETYCDLWISKTPDGAIIYSTSSNTNIEFHSTAQAPYHPVMNEHPYPKWMNPWAIRTPKGYSCLFINPVHKSNNYFTILEGVVDTDKYFAPVNFPFVLNDTNFEGLIPAGTPLAQIIPFKRESWKHKIGTEKEEYSIIENDRILRTKFFDRYKTLFWNKKEYR
jgi:hypothetical protein